MSINGTHFLLDSFVAFFYKTCMKSCGKHVMMHPISSDIKGLTNLSIGNDSIIPKQTVIFCTKAPLTIGNKVMFGPRPTIITGDHRIDIIGKYMVDVADDEKKEENDQAVIIEDDVWCGANVTILKGVVIGRGSVVGAGSVVTKSFPPYSIICGVPARKISSRFTPEQIAEHELKLNL